MRILYPTDPFNPRNVDESFLPEATAFEACGFEIGTLSDDDLQTGLLRARPPIKSGETLLYRGWMVTVAQYQTLERLVSNEGAKLLTSSQHYERCHLISGWYEALEGLTPKTIFFDDIDQFKASDVDFQDKPAFVKDFVKSNTFGSSIARSYDDVIAIAESIKTHRGRLEGGLCIRNFIEFNTDKEDRHFVYKGRTYSRNDETPAVVAIAAEKVDSPFFSVDTCVDTHGKIWIVEVGDGQVSDHKNWTLEQFTKIFSHGG